jgi:CheY-like chemotaxis protein
MSRSTEPSFCPTPDATPILRGLPETAAHAAPLRAYLVEGNAHVRESLAAALEELAPLRLAGVTADERTAREWLKTRAADCDLLIVDLFLNSGSGLGVLQAARSARPAVPTIVLCTDASPGIRARCLAAGAERVFDTSRDIDLVVGFCAKLAQDRGTRPGKPDAAAGPRPRAARGMSLAADPR